MLDLATGMQCAELQARPEPLSSRGASPILGHEYGTACLVVERNNHGSGVLAYLKSVCHYPRVLQQAGQEGWLTSSLSHPAMIGRLAAALVERPNIFQSRRFLEKNRQKLCAASGMVRLERNPTYDDCVMAMAIALSARG